MKKNTLNLKIAGFVAIALFLFFIPTVAKAQSSDATLKDIKVGGVTVAGFASTILTYNFVLPFGSTVPLIVTATPNSSHAIEFITQASSVTGTASILVTAQDGITTKTYSVIFSVFPFASSDATIVDLLVGGTTVAGFDKKTFSYSIVLPYGTLVAPLVSATVNEPHATTIITQAISPTSPATVVVTAQDGITKNTFTINFSLALPSTIATLSDLKAGTNTVNGFASDILVYNVLLPAGTTIIPVITATVTEPHSTAIITQALSVTGSATVVVTAQDGVTVKSYTINFSVASTIATLSDMKTGTNTLTGFASDILVYNVLLPAGTTIIPVVTATVTESHATAFITQAVSVNGSATVVVTAQDGVTVKTYTINFSVTSTLATLSNLKTGANTVNGFASDILVYNVLLPAGTTIIPVVTATVTESHATVIITQALSVTGSATVVVTAQDGVTVKSYTINFSVASTIATLDDLKTGTNTVNGFASDILVYNVLLPAGTTVIPVVTATVTESHATAIITQASSVNGSAKVVVTAQDGITVKTYTINFSVTSTIATLSDLKTGANTVNGFTSDILIYNVLLPAGTTIIPVVTATVTESHATAFITQASSVNGSAKVFVTAQDGVTVKTYTINFSVASTIATLSDLKTGTNTVSGFASDILVYNVLLPLGSTIVPVVTATVSEPNATAIVTQAPSVTGSATVVVTAQDGLTSLTYTINFSVASTGLNDFIEKQLIINQQDGNILIELSNGINQILVSNIEGKMMLNEKINSTVISIDSRMWISGIYLIRISSGNITISKKIRSLK